jgi:hypothetical protein
MNEINPQLNTTDLNKKECLTELKMVTAQMLKFQNITRCNGSITDIENFNIRKRKVFGIPVWVLDY